MEDSGDNLLFYYGSRLLNPVSHYVGIPIDQVNFVVCELIALLLAYPFRRFLSPRQVSPTTRHAVELGLGLVLCIFCFGYQTFHIVFESTLCLVLMKVLPQQYQQIVVMVVALFYLSVCHIYRMVYDWGGYTLDITGPLMIVTEKVSSLSFSLYDGSRKDQDKLTPNQKQQQVKKPLTYLEYYSYIFSFHGLMCGPFVFFMDYKNFIEGHSSTSTGQQNVRTIKKLAVTAIAGAGVYFILPHFPVGRLADPDFLNANILVVLGYMTVTTTVTRMKYYFAWKLGEACNTNAGLGFRGDDDKTDFLNVADIQDVELSCSLRNVINGWNKTTLLWLRHCVYERVRRQGVLAVFIISSLWHGFYPGYYFTFFTGALFTETARVVRRTIRPLFQGSSSSAFVYDCITFTFARVALAYMSFPFVMLEIRPAFQVYVSMYFWLHILAVLGLLVLPRVLRPAKSSKAP